MYFKHDNMTRDLSDQSMNPIIHTVTIVVNYKLSSDN